jgi:endonuclease/exonuclease/phosphatase (EEP) superfamily protein YafD
LAAVTTLALVGRLTVLTLLLPVIARLLRLDCRNGLIAMVTTFLPWLVLPATAAGLAGVVVGDWLLVAMAGSLVATLAVWARPEWAVAEAPAAHLGPGRLRLATINVWEQTPDIGPLLDHVDHLDPDLVALQEIHERHDRRLGASRLAAHRPYRVPAEAAAARQTVVLSRLPFRAAERITASFTPFLSVTLTLDGGPVTVLAVHPPPPSTSFRAWRADFRLLAELVRTADRPLVVLGDCNATLQHRLLREVLACGVRDAHLVRGHGLGWTWRHHRYPGPPLRLDRVMVSPELEVTAITVGQANGSDHRPVVVEVARRPDAGQNSRSSGDSMPRSSS